MTTHLVTFSDESMSRSAELCDQSARAHGIKHVHCYAPAHVEDLLLRNGIDPLARGCGYWAWKPAIILETMNRLGRVDTAFNLPGDNVIVYADAGVEFINNVSHIIDRMDQDIFLFGNNWEHAHWCKRDVVEAVWPLEQDAAHTFSYQFSIPHNRDEDTWARFSKQVQASVIFFRISDYTRKFVAEWLKWCLAKVHSDFLGDRHLIDDSPSFLPNHPEFQEHRHDQAILTTLAYREGVKLHYWPATYNDGAFNYEKLPCYAGDDYPILFHHHRRRNHEWPAQIGARCVGMTLEGERYTV